MAAVPAAAGVVVVPSVRRLPPSLDTAPVVAGDGVGLQRAIESSIVSYLTFQTKRNVIDLLNVDSTFRLRA